ncbi:hypothetical protein R1sor_019364 [Riccia sorocarpa]|uniref:Uncharacterized protein n=1 Tax=Riccia sorocarpa TaxID=122646 RepID=A0ABD3ICF9_9MARC
MASRGAGLVRRGRLAAACDLLRVPADRFRVREISCQASISSFAVAFDIDGVLLRGGQPIGGAPGALRRLYGDPSNPCGGCTEASKADELSRQLDVPVLFDQVLLGHTPFRNLADKHVVKIDSYVHEFEHIDGLARSKPWHQTLTKVMADPLPDHLSIIAGVFIVSDPYEWNRDIQVLCDVLRTGGRPGRDVVHSQPQPPLFFAADDMDYQSTFPVPRLGMGAFRVGLESIYNRLPGAPLHWVSYGKPQLLVYKNAERVLEEISKKIPEITAEVSAVPKHHHFFKTIYMVGDNPTTDIIGAKFAGHPWFSILTRTGCYRGQAISSLYHADKVVEDVEEAVDFIMRRENMG